jgi:tetratricopeptide (TPR) repeat protein
MIKMGVDFIRSLVNPAVLVRGARARRAGAAFFLGFTLLTTQFGLISAVSAADARLDAPYVLRDRALQNALKHSQQPEDIEKAINLYRAAINRSEKEYGADSTYTAQLYFELGNYALDNSKFTVAVESLNRAVELDPNATTPRLRLVKLYELRKEPNAARQQLIQLLKKHPDSREGRQLLVNEIQSSDPAAATRQAFRIDKLVLASLNPITMPNAVSPTPAKSAAGSATTSGATKTPTAASRPGNSPPPQNEKVDIRPNLPMENLSPAMLLRTRMKPTPTPPPQEQTAQVSPIQPVIKPPLAVPPASMMTAKGSGEKSPHRETKPKPKKAQSAPSRDQGAASPKAEKAPRAAKLSSKGGKGGLVPPPPPLPFMPVYPGMVPPPGVRTPVGVPSVELKTDAKIKRPTTKKEAKGESTEGKSEAKTDAAKSTAPAKATAPSATKPASEQDPDFLLDWASIHKKKKGSQAKEPVVPAKEAPAAKETPKEAAKEAPKEAAKEAPKEAPKEAKDAN